MIRNFLFFSLFIFSINVSAQKKNDEEIFINRVINTWTKMSKLNNEYLSSIHEKADDSLISLNTLLASLISSSHFAKISMADLNRIARLTELKILISKDSKFKVISWTIYNELPEPSSSNIFIVRNKKPQIISLNGTAKDDFGINVEFDTIIDIGLKNISSYLLLGHSKCGNLCIRKSAYMYATKNFDIIKRKKVFFDNKTYSDHIEFEYTINDKMKSDLYFKIQNMEILAPIFSMEKLNTIGFKRYKITTPN